KDENVFVGQKPNLYMPEKLIEYFEVAASENIKYRNLLNSRLDAISKYGQEPTALRIFNLLTVLSIVSHPLIQPTRDLITTLLSTKNTDNVADVLDTLTDQRTLRYRKETDRYELPVLNFGEISAREGINKVKEIISEEVEYEKEFAKIAKLEEIRAREYANNHGIDRIGIVEIVNVSHIKNLNSYLDDIKSWYSIPTKQYKGDAKILFVFVEDHSQLDQLQRQLDKGTGSQQLIVAVPKAPYTNIDKLFDLVAIKYIRENLAYQVGGENVDEEDLKSLEDDLYGTVREDVFNYTQADNCIWYYGDSRQASLHAGEDEKLLSEIMEGVFGETPLVIDEAINVTGRDTNKKHRKAAMAQLLEVEGNIRIKNEGGNASHRILRNTLRNTRLLEKVNDLGLEQEYIIRENILKDSPVYEIWKKFEDYFMQSEPSNFEELYFELVNPPIGVRVQLIELLLAAYLRKIKNQVLIFDSDRDFQQVHVNSNLIDNITKYPHRYFLTFFELIPEQKEFLEKMASVLSIEQEPAGLSLVEDVHVLLKGWFGNLSDGAKLSPELPSDIREFTKTLRENDSDDNVKDFVTVMIPKLLGQSPDKWHQGTASRLVEKFVEYKETLDNYSSRRGYMAVENLCNIFGTQGHTNEELITATTNWFNNLSEAQRLHHFSGSGAGLIKAIRTGTGSVEERFLIKLAKELTNRTFLNWESDDDMNEFLAEVRFGKTSVENWSINPPSDGKPLGGANKEKTLGVLKEEIYQLFAVHKTDNVDIISILQEILKDISQK
ncbi:MAG: hypothetical protein H8D23_15240, partial [Candidatus Brocadiales bacterium]|nr:hypothetical protein [Candidatus Brocadiales bacterium]